MNVITGGYLVVTGNFTQNGANNQGSFEVTGGSVYILDPTPGIKTGTGFADLQCDPACGYGDESDLSVDPIFNFFESGGYSISASGPTSFCAGGSVDLSVEDDGSYYQWLKDGLTIAGASSYIYTATTSGSYSLKMVVASDTLDLEPVVITVSSLSIAPTSADVDRNDICPADGNIVLSFTGGTLGTNATAQWYSDAAFTSNVGNGNNLTLATPNSSTTYYVRFEGDCNTTSAASVLVNINQLSTAPDSVVSDPQSVCAGSGNITLTYYGGTAGTGALARWYDDPALTNLIGTGNDIVIPVPGVSSKYYFRFEGSCNSTGPDSAQVTVHPLPVAGFAGLTSPVCENSSDQLLTGNYAPEGTFSGTGITDNGDGTADFSPSVSGTYTIKYVIDDVFGCSDSVSQPVTVNPLPSVDFAGMNSPVCVGTASDLLTGSAVSAWDIYGNRHYR